MAYPVKKRVWIVFASIFVVLACQADTQAPTVVGTSPVNGRLDVDPGLISISVTFNEPMLDRSWSFVDGGADRFPRITGDPSYDSKFETISLPVALESDKTYEIWINSGRYLNFKDKVGNPATPYRLTFKTR